MTPNWKPSRAARKADERKTKLDRKAHEEREKKKVRVREHQRCRFPLCGCGKLKIRLEVSHDDHKGMGGNPSGDRSQTASMVLLCVTRHQDSLVCRHRGTLEARPLTEDGYDGPVAWWIDPVATAHIMGWTVTVTATSGDAMVEIARETKPGELEPLLDWQETTLKALAKMDA